MKIDVEYIFGIESIERLEKLFKDQPHGEREYIADEIDEFVEKMELKYGPKI